MKRVKLVVKYSLIAAFSIMVNMAVQFCINFCAQHYIAPLFTVTPASVVEQVFVYIGILTGATVSLMVKYTLDKRFIFGHKSQSSFHNAKTFAHYSLMSIVPTAIYWISELSFHHLFGVESAKYIGGILGQGLGYIVKYNLDKRWVFRKAAKGDSSAKMKAAAPGPLKKIS